MHCGTDRLLLYGSLVFGEGAGNLFKTFPGRRCILVAHEGRLVYDAWEKTQFALLHIGKTDLFDERFMVDRKQMKTEMVLYISRLRGTLIQCCGNTLMQFCESPGPHVP